MVTTEHIFRALGRISADFCGALGRGLRFFPAFRAHKSLIRNPENIARVMQLDLADLHTLARNVSMSIKLHCALDRPLDPEVPCLFVVNHPKGAVDALTMLLVANVLGTSSKVMLWDALMNSQEHRPSQLIPVPMGVGDIARKALAFRQAKAHLRSGGDLFVMPAGGVPRPAYGSARGQERSWSRSVGLLARSAHCAVVPVHVAGRLGRLPDAIRRFGGKAELTGIEIQYLRDMWYTHTAIVGPAISHVEVVNMGDDQSIADRLRQITCTPPEKTNSAAAVADFGKSTSDFIASATAMRQTYARFRSNPALPQRKVSLP